MAGTAPQPTALLLSPHPDDELLGCPAHLFGLRDAGWRIVNVALSLGKREERRPGRLLELERACERAGFELIAEPDGRAVPVERVLELARRFDTRLLVAPSPHDDHPAHESAGRLALASVRAGAAQRLWLWGLWADIAMPNSLCVFDVERLDEIAQALSAHVGELDRNDFSRLLRARALLGSILLPERVFGYGSPGLEAGALAEAVCDLHLGETGELMLNSPVRFDPRTFGGLPAQPAIGAAGWLDGPSPRQAMSADR
jgi:hypothetical protein